MNREECIAGLMKEFNGLRCWRECLCGNNVVKFVGCDDPLPPYIPQIGQHYFSKHDGPRILLYAINQNLEGSPEVVKSYTAQRDNNEFDKVLDRLNGKNLVRGEYGLNVVKNVGPYPHMNMLARLIIYLRTGIIMSFDETAERTAATNLIKCSTDLDRSTPNLIMYGNCAQKTCLAEIGDLEPDVVLAMGEKAFESLVHTLRFSVDKDSCKFAVPGKSQTETHGPQIIVSAYHSTGYPIAKFRVLQNHFDNRGACPDKFSPYLEMLTGKSYDEAEDYWDYTRAKYEEYEDLLLTKFADFFQKDNKPYRRSGYLCYFAYHFALFENALGRH